MNTIQMPIKSGREKRNIAIANSKTKRIQTQRFANGNVW